MVKDSEKGMLIGIPVIVLTLSFIVISIGEFLGLWKILRGKSDIFAGVLFIIWGILFFMSYFMSHKSFLLRGLLWICKNISNPNSTSMALFFGILFVFGGILTILKSVGIIK